MSNPRRIVAYSDLLGFSDLAVKDPEAAEKLLSEFYNYAQNIKVQNSYEELELFLFSDFLFVQGDRVEQVVNYMCQVYRKALRHSENSEVPMLIRGGVARGGVLTQDRREAPQVTKNFIVSPALTHAVKMESLVKGQRLLVSAKEREEIEHFWNPEMNTICYDQPSIKPSPLFRKYRYQDLLWARDLSLSRAQSREETMKHLEIAERLYRENIEKKKEVVAHYAETLRICLLSYSSLLEACEEDREFVSRFVYQTLIEYPHPSVWLGLLECVLLSKDAFAFHIEPAMASFLSHAVMSKHWGEVSSALAQDEHAQLSKAVEEFVSVAIPKHSCRFIAAVSLRENR